MSELGGPIMSSLIHSIQEEAISPKSSVTRLINMAKLAATKLGQDEFAAWCQKELEGYETLDGMPEYRWVTGKVEGYNPVQGRWQPVFVPDPEMATAIGRRSVGTSLPALESLLQEQSSGELSMSLSPKTEAALLKGIGETVELSFHFGRSSITHIVETVRTTILNWTIELEKKGILGDGVTFSPSEKVQAGEMHFHIAHVQNVGVIGGQVKNSTIDLHQKANLATLDPKLLRDTVDEIARVTALLPDKVREQVESTLLSLKIEIAKPSIDETVVAKSLRFVRDCCTEATGNVAAAGILHLLKELT